MASNESPDPPLPAVVEAVSAVLGAVNRYPDPTNASCAARSATATACRAARIAIGNGSCDILLAAGEALLEPGAELVYAWPSFSVYPHLAAASGATAITVALNDRHEHDLDAMAARDHRRHAAGHRLQPEQPDLDGAALRRDRGLRRAGAAPRLRDPRRGLLRVQHARRPRRHARPPQAPPEPRAAADLLEGLRPLRAARGLRAVRLGGLRHRGQPGPPALLLQRRRPGRGDRGAAPPGRGHRARRAHHHRPRRARGRPRDLGIEPAESQANFCWFDLPVPDGEEPATSRPASCAASPSAASSCARAARSASPGALRVTYGTPEQNARFLRELGALL